jgi:hypothetical protein
MWCPLQAWRESSERQLSQLSAEVFRTQQALEDARAQLHTKASVVEVGQALAVKADLAEMEDKLRDKVRGWGAGGQGHRVFTHT